MELNRLFAHHHEVRITPVNSGCAELDSEKCQHSIFVVGSFLEAERRTDVCESMLSDLGYKVRRTGPRTLFVVKAHQIKHFTEESASF